jgi:hypothetical protein
MFDGRPLNIADTVNADPFMALTLAGGMTLPKDAAALPRNLDAAFLEMARLMVKVSVLLLHTSLPCYFLGFL